MSTFQPNPYDSPGIVLPEAKQHAAGGVLTSLDYGAMFRFPFDSPNWIMALVWGSLCFLASGIIPILPQLVFTGYLWMVFDGLLQHKTNTYDDFDLNRFSDYLSRSIAPFLASLIISLPLAFLIIPIAFVSMFVVGLGFSQSTALGVVFILLAIVAYVALMVSMTLLMMPMMLRAGISQELGQAFDFGWAKQFISLMWKDILVGTLAMAGAAIAAEVVGLMLFCVGIYPLMVAVFFANTHFQWQLYEIFLSRGGTPVPQKIRPYVATGYVPPQQY
jgi:hypothetical protein